LKDQLIVKDFEKLAYLAFSSHSCSTLIV